MSTLAQSLVLYTRLYLLLVIADSEKRWTGVQGGKCVTYVLAIISDHLLLLPARQPPLQDTLVPYVRPPCFLSQSVPFLCETLLYLMSDHPASSPSPSPSFTRHSCTLCQTTPLPLPVRPLPLQDSLVPYVRDRNFGFYVHRNH